MHSRKCVYDENGYYGDWECAAECTHAADERRRATEARVAELERQNRELAAQVKIANHLRTLEHNAFVQARAERDQGRAAIVELRETLREAAHLSASDEMAFRSYAIADKYKDVK